MTSRAGDMASAQERGHLRRWKRSGQSFSPESGPLHLRIRSCTRRFCSTWSSYTGTCSKRNSATPAHLVVPADDEFQVAHELAEGLVLREQGLGAAGDLFLLLEVQVLDLSQHRHQLRGTERMGAVRVGGRQWHSTWLHRGGSVPGTQVGVCPWMLLQPGLGVVPQLREAWPGRALLAGSGLLLPAGPS